MTDALRYIVIFESAIAVGMLLALTVTWLRRHDQITWQVAILGFSFSILIFIAGWSEWNRLGTDHLGWYPPLKALALSLAIVALFDRFLRRSTTA